MDARPMMKCGCAASSVMTAKGGVTFDPPIPACMIHDCYEIAASPPDLTGREANCAYGDHAVKPSSLDLAFFEFRGEGSREATEICKCGFSKKPHDDNGGKIPPRRYAGHKGCAGFTPKGPQARDKYYCGCRGWD